MSAAPRVIEVFAWRPEGPEEAFIRRERETDWRQLGRCAEIGGDVFFPEKGADAKAVKKVCQGCEVRAECLEFALSNGIREGIFGGLSERQRRPLLAARHAQNGLAA